MNDEEKELQDVYEEFVQSQKDRIGEMTKEEFDKFDEECNKALDEECVIRATRQCGKTHLTMQYLQLRIAEKEALARYKLENNGNGRV